MDVGAEHASAVRMPDGFPMIHDAGHFNRDGKPALTWMSYLS